MTMNQFWLYTDMEDSFTKVRNKQIDALENHPYHINEEDVANYIDGDNGGDDLRDIFKHKTDVSKLNSDSYNKFAKRQIESLRTNEKYKKIEKEKRDIKTARLLKEEEQKKAHLQVKEEERIQEEALNNAKERAVNSEKPLIKLPEHLERIKILQDEASFWYHDKSNNEKVAINRLVLEMTDELGITRIKALTLLHQSELVHK